MRVHAVKAVGLSAILALAAVAVPGAQGRGNQQGQATGNAVIRALFDLPAQQNQNPGEVELEGTLEILIEDHPASAVVHAVIETATERVRLRGRPDGSDFAHLTSGSRVRVRGQRLEDGTLELKGVRSGGGSTGGGGTTEASTDSGVTTMALASPNTFGEQKVIVILVNFTDTSAPYSWSHAHDVTFNQANNFFLENSYRQTWLTGDVVGWYTIAMSSSGCDYNTLASLADQAATNDGVNLNNYARRVYAFPTNGCGWSGLGTVGGNPSRAWVRGSYWVKVVAHELGHNLGDWHSNSQPCASGSCSTVEYGHDRDMMAGGQKLGHFNAYQKERLGWLNYGYSPPIQSVTASGTYWIESLMTPGSGAKALKILKSSTSSGNTYYYVEARTQHGSDSNYAPGVLLSTGHNTNGNSSYQVDLDPVSSSFDAVLDPGQTFSDSAAGFSITTVSSDSTGAWVRIEYAGTPCSTQAPSVTLSPGGTITTSPGATTSFTLSVKNNDNSACASAQFDLSMEVPSGWTWVSDRASLLLAPGATSSANVAVTAPTTAEGTAQVRGLAQRTSTGPSGTSSTAYLSVQSTTVASSIDVSLSIARGAQYTLTAAVSADGRAVSGASVVFTITNPNGGTTRLSATTNSRGTAQVKFKPGRNDPKGTYLVTVTATSGSLTATTSGSFTH